MRNQNRFLPTLFGERDAFVCSFDRLFDNLMKTTYPDFTKEFGIDFFEKAGYPKWDVYRASGQLIIEAAIPGVKKEDIVVQYDKDAEMLSISYTKKEETDKTRFYYFRELKRSSFKRSIGFVTPEKFDLENIDAKLEDGILTLSIKELEPKQEEPKKVKEISIK